MAGERYAQAADTERASVGSLVADTHEVLIETENRLRELLHRITSSPLDINPGKLEKQPTPGLINKAMETRNTAQRVRNILQEVEQSL